MKIAQLTYLYEPGIGGVENHVKNLSERLVSMGHDVDVITSDFIDLSATERVYLKNEIINGVRVIRLPGIIPHGKHFYAQNIEFSELEDTLVNGNYDIVHCHSIPSNHFLKAYKYFQKYRKKLFVTPHFSPDDLERTFKTKLTPWYWRLVLIPKLKKVTRIFSVSPSEKDTFSKLTQIDKVKITVIPNSVDLAEFDSISEPEINQFKQRFQLDGPFVLFVGRIVYRKGIDILLKAMAETNIAHLKAMIIGPIGDQDYYNRLQNMIKELNLFSRIIVTQQPRHEITKAFLACDLFVLPTRGEVFGIVLAEAMACRKVVIGANVGGVPDLIKHNQNGLLFELEESDNLSKLIEQVITKPAEFQHIRERARQTIKEHYNWEINSHRIATIYQQT